MNTGTTRQHIRAVDQFLRLCAPIMVFMLMTANDARAGYIEDAAGKTVIHVTVPWLPDSANSATANRAELEMVREFQKRFPDIFAQRYRERYKADPARYGNHNWDKVEIMLHAFSGITVEGVESDLLAIAGGNPPDVLYVNFRKSDNYIREQFLYPLDLPADGYVGDMSGAVLEESGLRRPADEGRAGMTDAELNERVHRKIWPVINRNGPDGVSHVWALPYGGAIGKVLLYRKDLFDKNHVPYPTAEWTWDDVLNAVRRISDPGNGVYGIVTGRGKHESYHWITWLWSAGGEVMTYDPAADQWRCRFDSPEAAAALEFYNRLNCEKWVDSGGNVRRGYTVRNSATTSMKWDKGEIAMQFAYIEEQVFNTFNPELTGMVPVPLGPPGPDGMRIRAAELNNRMWGLFSRIRDPAVRDSAWEFIKWYDCDDALRIKTRVMVEGGLGQFMHPKYLRRFGYPEIERLAPKGWADIFDIAIATGKPEPYGRNSNLAYDMMSLPIQDAEQAALAGKVPWGEDRKADRVRIMGEILGPHCARANDVMGGIVPPTQRARRRGVAAVVLAGMIAVFTVLFRRVLRTFQPPAGLGPAKARWAFRKHAWAYLLLLPAVLSILLWNYYPFARGSVMAFQDYRILGGSKWVALDNFGDILFDPLWWAAAWNTLRYSFLVLFLTFLPPLVLAILLQEVPRGKILFRMIYYLPAVITGLVTIVLWKQFYEPSEHGVLNALAMKVPAAGFILMGLCPLAICLLFAWRLRRHSMHGGALFAVTAGTILFLGIAALAWKILLPGGEPALAALRAMPSRLFSAMPEPLRWLGDSQTAMSACVLPMVWAGMGPGCLIYLAALKSVPDDFYEAADLDGATFIDKILFIIVPTLKPLIMINFVGAFIASWATSTANILVMTGGAANTETISLHIWYKAFTFLKFGQATAAAWLLGFMLIGFSVQQLKMLARVEFKATGETR